MTGNFSDGSIEDKEDRSNDSVRQGQIVYPVTCSSWEAAEFSQRLRKAKILPTNIHDLHRAVQATFVRIET